METVQPPLTQDYVSNSKHVIYHCLSSLRNEYELKKNHKVSQISSSIKGLILCAKKGIFGKRLIPEKHFTHQTQQQTFSFTSIYQNYLFWDDSLKLEIRRNELTQCVPLMKEKVNVGREGRESFQLK